MTELHSPSMREVFGDEDDGDSFGPIELDMAGVPAEASVAPVPATASAMLTCPSCGAPVDGASPACAHCAAPLHQRFTPHPPAWLATEALRIPEPSVAMPVAFSSRPLGRGERFLEAIAIIPYDFWKRIALYPFLAALFGNGCTCRGLSAGTNVMLIGLAVLGVLGVVASARSQRSL